MTFIAICLLILSSVHVVLAADGALPESDVRVTLEYESTFAEALKESRAVCEGSATGCRPSAPTLNQLRFDRATCFGGNLVFGWRDQSALKDGAKFSAMLQELSAARKVFGCSGSKCATIVLSDVKGETDIGAETLSLCDVQAVGALYGPPHYCIPVLRKNAKNTLVFGITGQGSVSCSMGLRDFDVLFRGKAGEIEKVRQLVATILKEKPFNLTVMSERGSIVGARAFQASELLQGWREWATVRVDLEGRGKDAETTITTTILVSKQNSTERESWIAVSEQQEQVYLTALRAAFVKQGGVLNSRGSR